MQSQRGGPSSAPATRKSFSTAKGSLGSLRPVVQQPVLSPVGTCYAGASTLTQQHVQQQSWTTVKEPTDAGRHVRQQYSAPVKPTSPSGSNNGLYGQQNRSSQQLKSVAHDGFATCQIVVPRYSDEGRLIVAGNIKELGNWEPHRAVALSPCTHDRNMWTATVRLPVGTRIEAKLVVQHRGEATWEEGGNRILTLDANEMVAYDGQEQSLGGRTPAGFMAVLHHGMTTHNTHVTFSPASPTGTFKASELPLPLCKFMVPHKAPKAGEYLVLVGSIPEMGSWNPKQGLRLSWNEQTGWEGSVQLPRNSRFEMKVVQYSNGTYSYEPGLNRNIDLAHVLSSQMGVPSGQSAANIQAIFSCYWGTVDTTPAVVGGRAAAGSMPASTSPLTTTTSSTSTLTSSSATMLPDMGGGGASPDQSRDYVREAERLLADYESVLQAHKNTPPNASLSLRSGSVSSMGSVSGSMDGGHSLVDTPFPATPSAVGPPPAAPVSNAWAAASPYKGTAVSGISSEREKALTMELEATHASYQRQLKEIKEIAEQEVKAVMEEMSVAADEERVRMEQVLMEVTDSAAAGVVAAEEIVESLKGELMVAMEESSAEQERLADALRHAEEAASMMAAESEAALKKLREEMEAKAAKALEQQAAALRSELESAWEMTAQLHQQLNDAASPDRKDALGAMLAAQSEQVHKLSAQLAEVRAEAEQRIAAADMRAAAAEERASTAEKQIESLRDELKSAREMSRAEQERLSAALRAAEAAAAEQAKKSEGQIRQLKEDMEGKASRALRQQQDEFNAELEAARNKAEHLQVLLQEAMSAARLQEMALRSQLAATVEAGHQEKERLQAALADAQARGNGADQALRAELEAERMAMRKQQQEAAALLEATREAYEARFQMLKDRLHSELACAFQQQELLQKQLESTEAAAREQQQHFQEAYSKFAAAELAFQQQLVGSESNTVKTWGTRGAVRR